MRLLRAVRFDMMRSLASWRWTLVPLVFAIACWNEISSTVSERSAANMWDAPLSMLQNASVLLFVVALGFLLVTGDGYVQDRARGTVALTVLRSESRGSWWAARLLSMGALAAVYSLVGMASALVIGAVRLPISLDASAASQAAAGAPAFLYSRFDSLPVPVFLLFVVVYLAVALWALGALVLAVSVLVPRPYVPALVTVVWVALEGFVFSSLVHRGPSSVDPFSHLAFGAHFDTGGGAPTAWSTSVAVLVGAIAAAGAVGWSRLAKGDL